MVKLKRVYEAPEKADGFRILVDRLWPRGLSKEKANVALWFKEIAPTNELRKWFGHDPARWNEFQERYKKELDRSLLNELHKLEQEHGTVTLVYGARDTQHNQAVVLKNLISTL